MAMADSEKWLLLIHQIPPGSNALRVRIWRRLQQIGAVAIKQSVYAMPFSDQSREDLNWLLKEIMAEGGEGSISEARFLEGLNDKQIVALFRKARRSDYEKIIADAGSLLDHWVSDRVDVRDPVEKGPAQVYRLRRRLDDIAAIDFFQTPERNAAETVVRQLEARLSGQTSARTVTDEGLDRLKGNTWVTRRNIFVDRMACIWLIRRFVDETAIFKFINAAAYTPRPGELRFDMFDGEYTHEGNRCTFEVMVRRFGLRDRALAMLTQVVHDIDLKDAKYGRAETEGFSALLTGLAASHPDDEARMAEGLQLFENLYSYFRQHSKQSAPDKNGENHKEGEQHAQY